MISGVGAGEGLAAVRGHQSGAEGAAVEMPTLSREIIPEALSGSASRRQLRFDARFAMWGEYVMKMIGDVYGRAMPEIIDALSKIIDCLRREWRKVCNCGCCAIGTVCAT